MKRPATRNIIKIGAVSAVLALGSACSDDDDDPIITPAPSEASVRVLHASPDAPPVNIQLNDSDAITELDFGSASAITTVEAGSYDISVDALTPAGEDGIVADVIRAEGTALDADMQYNILAVGPTASIAPLVIAIDDSFDDSQARVTVAHAATGVQAVVDVHVTGPDDALSADTVVASLNYQEFTETPLLVPAGDYRIRLALQGTLDAVYDSGTVAVPAGADLLIAALDNTSNISGAATRSPVVLSVNTGDSSALVFSQGDGGDLRIVHNSVDAPAVDVIANDALTLVDGLTFPNASEYFNVPSGTYNVKVAADADNSVVAIEVAEFAVENASVQTVIATGLLADASIGPVVINETARPVATHAKVQIAHASTVADNLSADGVDIYVLPADDTDISDNEPAVSGFTLNDTTDALDLAPASYNVFVTLTGTQTVAIEVLGLGLEAGTVYLVSAIDTPTRDGAQLQAYTR